MRPTTALLSPATDQPLVPQSIERRDLRPDDVAVAVSHCGVCHTDLHAWHGAGPFPLVPGHEFVGTVSAAGSDVTAFEVGDAVAVGNIVDSCGVCDQCRAGYENGCREFPTLTYGGHDRQDGSPTLGGYASEYVVRERFVYRRPEALDAAAVAPLMCAGITVWEPLRHAGVGPGTRLGVVGVGGLGHLAVRLGAALGAEVTALTTSAEKAAAATELGAQHAVVTSDEAAMADVADSLDVVIDCVPVEHDLAPLLTTVAVEGRYVVVGHLGTSTVDAMDLLSTRRTFTASGSAGRPRTQELLDFCGEHGIVADVEVLPTAEVMTAFERLERGDVRYRFVLDLADL